ncbi:type II toxin-antitoxin system VapC family toxin [Roseofilum casamattae]|uniref:PIN domain-containing protein n=1 Tax=Roseofilum casamattae BLCC-M143 TaxID=3022442 RepID=A0ABT7BXJ5_9CYAN|nr:PIN domain-containing protein [Roseofilum casamattae]MDJ1183259.1 PIN domain-containing protein [Roseofilum casamattae BLCC-M143]
MAEFIILDSAPVGLITNPKATPIALRCQQWLLGLIDRDYEVVLPEIVDYEVRRELLRANKVNGLARLDRLRSELVYLPITSEVMLKAAQLWAEARHKGKPTADNKALDGDVILAAQALSLEDDGHEVLVATSNVKHLSLFVKAKLWENI